MNEIQGMTPVKDSIVWNLLDKFYENQGPNAWSEELVPQGSTANCYTADTYAEIVSSFFRDLERNGCKEKPIIIELGGGNGRFAWQFLNRLINYQYDNPSDAPDFTYLLSDAATSNIDSWKKQKRFQNYIEEGILEFAEIYVDEDPMVKMNGEFLKPSDFQNRPVIIIANYLFDSIPCDLVHIKDNNLHRVSMSLKTDDDNFLQRPLVSFKGLKEEFSSSVLHDAYSGHGPLDDILSEYAKADGEFYVPVSVKSFRFLESFLDRDEPLLMLAGDLAFSEITDFELGSPFIFDSYFAHYTNFHIFSELFKSHGGRADFQRHLDPDFCCGAFVVPGRKVRSRAETLTETKRSAVQLLKEFNPYDAHELTIMIQEGIGEATVRQVAAWMRFSKMDPDVAEACLPLLFEELEQGQDDFDREQLYDIFIEAYQAYFPDGSPVKIDYGIAQLCLALQFNEEALALLEESLLEFGEKPARLYVYALALIRLERLAEAHKALKKCIELDAQYGPAIRLIAENFTQTEQKKKIENEHLRVAFSDPKVLEKANSIFDENGVVLIDQMLNTSLVNDLYSAFHERINDWKKTGLGTPNNVGDKRFTFPVRLRPPFSDPNVFANPVLLDLLTDAMGAKPVLNAFGAVVTYNGARMQHVHREHPLLFASDEANRSLPTYAVTVLVPLVDLDESMGGTQLWEGTHKLDADTKWQGDPTVCYTPAGSALVFDYRVYHGGMPCSSEGLRPLLYFTYSLPWFVDTLAFESHAALGITERELGMVDEEHRDLLRFAKRIPE